MARHKPHYGTCHICGVYDKLSFEHIPPEKAFNDKPILKAEFNSLIESDFGFNPIKGGRIQQRGIGGYTLCESCNVKTGGWYADDFVEWCYQGFLFLKRTEGKVSMKLPYHIFPLRVLKQIVTMFFSINGPSFRDQYPDLVKFVLDRERKYLNPRIRIYIFHNRNTTYRYCDKIST